MTMHDKTFKNWSEISSDPNSPDALAYRTAALAGMRSRELIKDRIAYLCRLAEGKNVLDIGVVEHFIASSDRDEWLHGRLCKHAGKCLGMDILEKDVQELRRKGYNVIAGDVTKEPLASTFELIVVGDVIEHLGNPHGLFSNAGKMLAPGGRLVMTTPNPWYANAVIKNLFEGSPFTDSVDHVAWFDAGTLCELAARNGLHLDRYAGVVMTPKTSTARAALFFKLSPILIKLGIRPEFFAKTMIYEFVLPPSA